MRKRTAIRRTSGSRCSILELHLGTSCNLNCSFCYRKGRGYGIRLSLASEDCLAKLIADFAAQGGHTLYISGGYEPFSEPEKVCFAIRQARKYGLRIWIYTNGNAPALAQSSVQEFLAISTHRVRFSVHAIKPHTYHIITHNNTKSASLYDVFRNIKGLMDARPKVGGTEVGIGFLALSRNIRELINAAEFWRDMGADFFELRFDYAKELSAGREILQEIKHFRFLTDSGHFIPMRVDIGTYAYGIPCFASRCYAPFHKLVVDPFGLVWCCCLQAQPGYRPAWAKLGDLKFTSLSDIIECVEDKFPRSHCKKCTPYEAKFNLNKQNQVKIVNS